MFLSFVKPERPIVRVPDFALRLGLRRDDCSTARLPRNMTGLDVATNPLPCSVWITGMRQCRAAAVPSHVRGKKRVCTETRSAPSRARAIPSAAAGVGKPRSPPIWNASRHRWTVMPSSTDRPGAPSVRVWTSTSTPC